MLLQCLSSHTFALFVFMGYQTFGTSDKRFGAVVFRPEEKSKEHSIELNFL